MFEKGNIHQTFTFPVPIKVYTRVINWLIEHMSRYTVYGIRWTVYGGIFTVYSPFVYHLSTKLELMSVGRPFQGVYIEVRVIEQSVSVRHGVGKDVLMQTTAASRLTQARTLRRRCATLNQAEAHAHRQHDDNPNVITLDQAIARFWEGVNMEDQTVYVQALWHRFCEPFVRAVAFDPDKLADVIDDIAREEYEEMRDQAAWSDGEPDEVEDDIMTGGIFAESLASLNLSESELADLREDGIVFLEV